MEHLSIQNQSVNFAGEEKIIKVPIKSALPIWGATAVWLFFGLCMPMHKPIILILCLLLSVITAITIQKKVKKEYREQKIKFTSGNLELDTCVSNINDTLSQLEKSKNTICQCKPDIAPVFENITKNLKNIREAIINNPNLVTRLRRFFEYYLPTTVKLYDSYCYSVLHADNAENLSNSVLKIENGLKMINTAFEKQFNSLYDDNILDITTDISVLETMLKQDNLN